MNLIIHKSARLPCDPAEAFRLFSTSEGLATWLVGAADVEARTGGKYELFWDPADRENDSTIGCKVTAMDPDRLLAFEWKGPRQYKHFMNEADPLTHVVVAFSPDADGTVVHLVHSGWRGTPEWEEARQWFDRAWEQAFMRLQEKTSADGPGLPSRHGAGQTSRFA